MALITVLAAEPLSWSKRSNMQTWSQWGTLVKRQKFENFHTITECLLTTALQNRHIRSLRTPSVAGKRIQATSHTARFLETGLCVSTTVDTSPVPKPPGTSPTGPEYKITVYKGTSREIPTKCRQVITLWNNCERTSCWRKSLQLSNGNDWTHLKFITSTAGFQHPDALRVPRRDYTL